MKQHLNSTTLIDYLHHELPPSEDAEALAHLQSCEACSQELNVEASISDRLRASAREADLEVPAGLRSAIMARIAAQRQSPWQSLRSLVRPLVIVPVAAALATAAFLLGPVLLPQSSHAGVPVSYYLQQYADHAGQNPLADRGIAIMASFDDGAR
jgi:anti-sigma factor (TIGR02949 family)